MSAPRGPQRLRTQKSTRQNPLRADANWRFNLGDGVRNWRSSVAITSMPEEHSNYEFFEHTADIGIRAEGSALSDLFVRLAQGLSELIAENSVLEPVQSRPIQLTADSPEALLLTWLQELLFWFSTERFLPVEYVLEEVTPTTLRGHVRGDTFDPARHVQGREVKAITRYLLQVESRDGRWYGQVIVDI